MGAATLIVTAAALLVAGAFFGASLYDTVVIAPNLRASPAGMAAPFWRSSPRTSLRSRITTRETA